MRTSPWVQEKERLEALASDTSRPVLERVNVLTHLFFHVSRDVQEAAKVVRRIQDLTAGVTMP